MKGRVALVTGGTGGIGTAICKRLAAAGAKVAAAHSPGKEEKAKAWQQQAKSAGLDIAVVPGNVTDLESCKAMVAQVESSLGPIGILVNNAGITRDTTFRKMSAQQWQEVMDTNLNSVFNVTQPIINGMLERGYGRIINISSLNGEKGQFGQTNYSAAKAGMHGFTKALAQEVASKGITVNTVSPGYIATEMVMAVPEKVMQAIVSQIPVGRLGTPEEIAEAVAFLASDSAGYMTGANLSMNGGQHMY